MADPASIPSGATLGMLGGGQLGRMFTQAAQAMGYQVHIFCPEAGCPASQIAEAHTCADYDDLEALAAFADGVSVVSLEFENIPATTAQYLSDRVPVRPGLLALETAQHRLREKTFLSGRGFPVAAFQAIHSEAELASAVAEIGLPSVLKTAGFGYDGKGQFKLDDTNQVSEAWASMNNQPAVLEAWITFEREVSILAARNPQGDVMAYPLLENDHRNHILDVTRFPAEIDADIQGTAEDIAQKLMQALGYVGLLCIEFFLQADGRLLINEIAPRPHNSGHVTIEAAETSQYEQQVRAICGLSLGSTAPRSPGAMVNLLGDVWEKGEPDWSLVDGVPGATLHLYGKAEARPGRKMGHITLLNPDPMVAAQAGLKLRDQLARH